MRKTKQFFFSLIKTSIIFNWGFNALKRTKINQLQTKYIEIDQNVNQLILFLTLSKFSFYTNSSLSKDCFFFFFTKIKYTCLKWYSFWTKEQNKRQMSESLNEAFVSFSIILPSQSIVFFSPSSSHSTYFADSLN